MTKPKDDTWVVKLDEHHPDHRVAATHADYQALLFTRRVLSERIKALVTRTAALTYEEDAELKSARYRLRLTNESIENFDKEKENE